VTDYSRHTANHGRSGALNNPVFPALPAMRKHPEERSGQPSSRAGARQRHDASPATDADVILYGWHRNDRIAIAGIGPTDYVGRRRGRCIYDLGRRKAWTPSLWRRWRRPDLMAVLGQRTLGHRATHDAKGNPALMLLKTKQQRHPNLWWTTANDHDLYCYFFGGAVVDDDSTPIYGDALAHATRTLWRHRRRR